MLKTVWLMRFANAKNKDDIPAGWGINLSRFNRVSKTSPGSGRAVLGELLVEGTYCAYAEPAIPIVGDA